MVLYCNKCGEQVIEISGFTDLSDMTMKCSKCGDCGLTNIQRGVYTGEAEQTPPNVKVPYNGLRLAYSSCRR